MVTRLRRRSWREVALAYLAVVLFLFGLMIESPGNPVLPPAGQAPGIADQELPTGIPVLGPAQPAGGGVRATAEGQAATEPRTFGLRWLAGQFRPGAGALKGMVASQLALLGAQGERGKPAFAYSPWRRAVEVAASYLSGIDPGDPRSLLGAQLPVFVGPDRAQEDESSFEPTPFDPRDFLWIGPARPPEGAKTSVEPIALGDRPLVGFYSTHAYESYLSEMVARPRDLGDVTTWDDRKNVVRVAEEIARTLTDRYGVPTVHSAAHHSDEGQAQSYKWSRRTALDILRRYPSVKILADIHRDSEVRGPETLAQIKGEGYARVMLVVATGSRELPQANAAKTLVFAREIWRVMEEKYPGIGRQVLEKPFRFNQDLLPAMILIEVGGVENTMDESLRSARAMADVLAEVIRQGKYPG